jgi:hypothetical protein
VLLSVYVVAGALYAIGAWLLIGRLASASPQVDRVVDHQELAARVGEGGDLFAAQSRSARDADRPDPGIRRIDQLPACP